MKLSLATSVIILVVLLMFSLVPAIPATSESPYILFSTSSVSASAQSQSNSITLSSGYVVYLYAAVTGGGQPVETTSFSADLSVSNSNQYISGSVIDIGHSSNDTGSFTTQGSYYAIGGIGVNYANYSFVSSENSTSGANSTSGTFNVSENQSLVVLISASSNNYNGTISSSIPFTTEARTTGTFGADSSYAGVIIAEAVVDRGEYNYTVNYAVGPGDPYASSVGAVAYVFPQVSAVKYNVTFTESNLPPGSTWFVNLSNGSSFSSTNSVINFGAYNGTYFYTISSNTQYSAFPSSGKFTVQGHSVPIPIIFKLVSYTLSFTETGLAVSTMWSVTVNGVSESSYTDTINFSETNGVYNFVVNVVSGYSASPSSGTVKVNGLNVTKNVVFTAEEYSVTFVESGLPSGTQWLVSLNGSVLTSTSDNITFLEPRGTYLYTVSPEGGITPSPQNGSTVVNGGNVTIYISFQSYLVTLKEHGLPPGTIFSVNLGGRILTSSNGTIFVWLGNGSYKFTVISVTGYSDSPRAGTFVVSGKGITIPITFNFESPANQSWFYSPVLEVVTSFAVFIVLSAIIFLVSRGEKNGN